MNIPGEAIEYTKQNLSVIPLAGKRPIGEWIYYQSHIASEKQIDIWWSLNRDANVGVVTGSISKLVIIDFDYDAKRTFATGYPLIRRYLGDSFVISRTGKGFHCLIRTNEAKMFRNSKIAKSPRGVLIETRAEGGYIVAPPSIHPETNRLYEFTNCKRVNDLALVDYDTIVELLKSLNREFHIESGDKYSLDSSSRIINGEMEVEDIENYINKVVNKVGQRLANASKGERNTELFKCAAALGSLSDYIDEGTIYECLLTASNQNGYLQEDKRGAAKTIRSAMNKADRIKLKENPWKGMGITIGD